MSASGAQGEIADGPPEGRCTDIVMAPGIVPARATSGVSDSANERDARSQTRLRLSRLNGPAPKAITYNSPPIIATFFMK